MAEDVRTQGDWGGPLVEGVGDYGLFVEDVFFTLLRRLDWRLDLAFWLGFLLGLFWG